MKGFIELNSKILGVVMIKAASIEMIRRADKKGAFIVFGQNSLEIEESYEEVCRMIAAAQSPAAGMERSGAGGME